MDNGASSYRRFRDEGDEAGLVEIIRDHKDGLIFYLNSFVGDIHTAEELAEDTFVKLFTRKPRNNGKSSFRTWLYAIGRNVAIDYLRRHRREVSTEECSPVTDEEMDLERNYLREERRITVHRAMARLKPEYRQILWLVYFEGFSHREAALVMGKSEHHASVLANRARKSLRTQLEKEGFIYEEL